MRNILVIGGAGFIGSHIVDCFIKKGDKVRVFDNLYSGKIDNVNIKAEFIEGDIRDFDSIKAAMVGIDYVFHEAAIVSVPLSFKNPQLNHDVNVLGTRNVLEAAYQEKVRKVIIASSAAVYGNNQTLPLNEELKLNPLSPYGEAKLQNEMDGAKYSLKGVPVVALRYFNVFGARQDSNSPYSGVISIFFNRAKDNKELVIYGDGTQTRDLIYIKDVVKANVLGLDLPAGNYNVATGLDVRIKNVAEKIIDISNSKSKIIYSKVREGDIKKSLANVKKIKSFGFELDYDVDKGFIELSKNL